MPLVPLLPATKPMKVSSASRVTSHRPNWNRIAPRIQIQKNVQNSRRPTSHRPNWNRIAPRIQIRKNVQNSRRPMIHRPKTRTHLRSWGLPSRQLSFSSSHLPLQLFWPSGWHARGCPDQRAKSNQNFYSRVGCQYKPDNCYGALNC